MYLCLCVCRMKLAEFIIPNALAALTKIVTPLPIRLAREGKQIPILVLMFAYYFCPICAASNHTTCLICLAPSLSLPSYTPLYLSLSLAKCQKLKYIQSVRQQAILPLACSTALHTTPSPPARLVSSFAPLCAQCVHARRVAALSG